MATDDKVRYVLQTEEDAQNVLAAMQSIIKVYGHVTLGDLNTLVGLPETYLESKVGWLTLEEVKTSQLDEGFLLMFPKPKDLTKEKTNGN